MQIYISINKIYDNIMVKSLENIYKNLNLEVRTYIKNDLVPKGMNSGCDLIQHGYCPIY